MRGFATGLSMLAMIAFGARALAQPQTHDHSNHEQQEQIAPDPHAGHRMPGMARTDPHAGHDMTSASMPEIETSADNPGRPPEAPPPAAASGGPVHAADLYFDPAVMQEARTLLRAENGAMRTGAAMLDEFETTIGDDEESYAWDAQGWYGGDIKRFWWKSDGEGDFGDALEEAELQLLYGRAFSPYFDLQAGMRQVYTPDADRSDLVLGIQGLAPYWFEIDVAAFLSNEGELRARAESEYDLRVTQRLILQLHAELNLSAEDIPELAISSGITSVEVGLRLRYEFSRRFAPYAGIQWTGTNGYTSETIGTVRKDSDETRFVIGLRAWY